MSRFQSALRGELWQRSAPIAWRDLPHSMGLERGSTSSAWALARHAARLAMESVDRGIATLHAQERTRSCQRSGLPRSAVVAVQRQTVEGDRRFRFGIVLGAQAAMGPTCGVITRTKIVRRSCRSPWTAANRQVARMGSTRNQQLLRKSRLAPAAVQEHGAKRRGGNARAAMPPPRSIHWKTLGLQGL